MLGVKLREFSRVCCIIVSNESRRAVFVLPLGWSKVDLNDRSLTINCTEILKSTNVMSPCSSSSENLSSRSLEDGAAGGRAGWPDTGGGGG